MAVNTKGEIFADQAKYYYYLAGLSVAVFAYVVKDLEPVRIGANTHTIEIAGLIVIAVSIYLCLKIINLSSAANHSAHLTIESLRELELLTQKGDEVRNQPAESDWQIQKKAEELESIRDQMTQHIGSASRMADFHLKQLGMQDPKIVWQSRTFFGALFLFAAAKILEPYFA